MQCPTKAVVREQILVDKPHLEISHVTCEPFSRRIAVLDERISHGTTTVERKVKRRQNANHDFQTLKNCLIHTSNLKL